MSAHPDYLTASDFYKYLQCPHWPYYDRFATEEQKAVKREPTDLHKRIQEDGLLHEERVVKKLFGDQPVATVPSVKDAEKDAETTLELMKQGAPLIYQGTLTDGDWTGRPDLLERHDGESAFGAWHYVPVDVKSTHHLEKYQRLQLTFYATLLERIQKRFPAHPAIINMDHERLEFEASSYITEFESVLAEIERIRAGERPDPVLRKSCFDVGPWGVVCQYLAQSTDDIAQLYNVDVKRLRAMREVGIRTVEDAAAMNPEALDGVAPGLRLHGLEVAKLQAQALKEHDVIVREPVALPSAPLEIHFDIESDPPNDFDYLYGILIRDASGEKYIPFIAERLEDEGLMWKSFLAWIDTLPADFVVYHFAPFELSRLGTLEGRHGGSDGLNRFRERMVDLKEIASSSIVYPLYFYGLKYIAKFLGFSWRGDVKGGGQSIDVFERFLETGDHALLDSIVTYNEDDVRATAYLADWLRAYATERTRYSEPYPWRKT